MYIYNVYTDMGILMDIATSIPIHVNSWFISPLLYGYELQPSQMVS